MYSIYALVDPRDSIIHYIGMSKDVQKRLLAHLQDRSKHPVNISKKVAWLDDLARQDLLPDVTIIETVEDRQRALVRESYWIAHYGYMPLTNVHILTGQKASHKKGTPRYYRAEAILSQSELSRLSNVPQTVISRCENGYPISNEYAEAILRALNTKIAYWNAYHSKHHPWKQGKPHRDRAFLQICDLDWSIQGEK